ncbi:MAG TPA: hypothetical protein VJB11_02760 [archaeon]|nr:hypothetical protein [archaeon]
MKGAMEAISVVLVTGVLIGVVGSIYFWGLPLIEKNKDISILENSEFFIKNLNDEIKNIANSGGIVNKKITVPATVSFDGENITLEVETGGTIYAKGAEIPLGRNFCTMKNGIWGVDNPEILCVKSIEIDDRFFTTYTLKYIMLESEEKNYKIQLDDSPQSGGSDRKIKIENMGSIEINEQGKTVVKTIVKITIS